MAASLPKYADYGQDITGDEIIRLERLLLEFGQRDAPSPEAPVTRPPQPPSPPPNRPPTPGLSPPPRRPPPEEQPTSSEGLPAKSRPPDFKLTPEPPPLRDLFDRLPPSVKGKGQGKPKGRSREGPYDARPWHYEHMPVPRLPPSYAHSRNWAVIYSGCLATYTKELTTFGCFAVGAF